MTNIKDVLEYQDNTADKRAVTGTVTRREDNAAIVRLQDGTTAVLPLTEAPQGQLPEEGHTCKMLLLDESQSRVSMTHPALVSAVAAAVIPELRDGSVRIMSAVRLPGVRAKVAVAATEEGVDPVSVCVGRRANRVRHLSEELGGEQVDIVAWHSDPEEKLRNAFAPANVEGIEIDGDSATVSVQPHLMAAAVGRGGLNTSLAGRLCGLRVNVVRVGDEAA